MAGTRRGVNPVWIVARGARAVLGCPWHGLELTTTTESPMDDARHEPNGPLLVLAAIGALALVSGALVALHHMAGWLLGHRDTFVLLFAGMSGLWGAWALVASARRVLQPPAPVPVPHRPPPRRPPAA